MGIRKVIALVVVLVLLSFASGVLAAGPVMSYAGHQFSSSQSIMTNGVSRMAIVKNVVDQDYSLKFYSGDGTKDVTVLRLKGNDAEQTVQQVYFMFQNVFWSWGMTVQ